MPISLLFYTLFLLACNKQKVAKDGTIYNGFVHLHDNLIVKTFENEFTLKTYFSKRFGHKEEESSTEFSLKNDSVYLRISILYDKKTKNITGTIHSEIKDSAFNTGVNTGLILRTDLVKGKKVGDDYALEIFYELGYGAYSANIPYEQCGSIYLTPKK